MYLWFFPKKIEHQCSVLPTDRIGKNLKCFPDEYTASYGVYERTYNISECPICGKEYPYNFGKFERTKTITIQEYMSIKEGEK